MSEWQHRVPAMPRVPRRDAHRAKIPEHPFPISDLVARPVGKKELQSNPAAKAAMDKEWQRLTDQKVWDMDSLSEWSDVAATARREGKDIQLGYVFGFCVEKNSGLREGRPNRKFKGRVVFRGNQVVNRHWETAIFQDLGNAPATMDASRFADFFGCLKDHDTQIADTAQAYIQAPLKGDACWVVLPNECRPASWKSFKKPVVRLRKALRGHPDSGTFWEQHCDEHARSVGFKPIGPEWPPACFNEAKRLLLVVYVDDFKLSGPKKHLASGWADLRKGLEIEEESPLGLCLGCAHARKSLKLPNGKDAVSVTCDMSGFFESCVVHCVNVAGGRCQAQARYYSLP